ncbi:MAG: RNA-binding protein [Acidobacteria bacterium]|nr:MAG: RNA-binding protein [Acidobacteriota bacterium]
MNFSRRNFVRLGVGAALSLREARLLAQGVASHTAKPLPRPAASGRPFNAHFVDVAAAAGLHAPVIYGDPEIKKYIVESTGCGCAFIDYDNDGWMDLFVLCGTRLGGAPVGTTNRLYKNNRDGTFTDVTEKAGLRLLGWACGVCVGDYNNDGFDDIFCTNFGQNVLYRNNGDGTFTDVTQQAGIARAAATYGMTVVAADFDEDGWQDIYVACDSTPSLLFMNNRDGTFREEGVLRGAALSDDGMEQAGMGIGIGDYDLDGHLDLFKTHFADDANILYRNDGKGNFEDATGSSHLGVETRYVCWGAGIVDLDNDGLPDLFMVTGHVYPQVERTLPQYPNKTPRVVFRNLGKGVFEELIQEPGPGVAAAHCSRGCAFGDFDNDGDIDILIINLNEPPSLLRNDLTGKSNWIKVKLDGVKSNRSAIGARVLVHYGGKTQAQAVLSQSSFFSCSDSRLHFGLGNSTLADIDVYWPSGLHETFKQIPANRLITLKEGVGPVPNRGWAKV